ncbi:hypothetical protein LCGC14_1694750, partial [marine sediment metagenome]
LKAIHPDDREFAIEQLTKKQKGEKDVVTHYQYRGIKKSGEMIWLDQFSKTIIFDEKPADFIMLIDITQRKNIEKKLHDERDLIYALLDNHPDFIYFKDSRARFQHISKRFCDFFGRKMEEIIGKTDLELFPEELAKQTHAEDLDIIQTGMPLINKEETTGDTWVLTTKMPWLNKKGNIKGLFGISRDITEFKKVEQNLKESVEKFRTITEQSFLGIAIMQDNIIKYLNNQLANIFGYTVEEIMNWEVGGFLNVIHPEDREMVANQARKKQLGESDSLDQYQFRGIKKNGDAIWLEIYSKSINYNGKPADFATIHDITDGKIFEQKLLESEEKYRSLFDNSPVGIGLSTIEGKAIDSNDALVELTGYSVEDLNKIGTPSIYVDPNVRSKILKALQEEGKLHDYEVELRRKDNSEFFGSVSFDLIELGGKKIIQTSLRDITKSKNAEQELIKLNKLKSELLRRTSHELKTPLVSIKGFSDLLL